MLCYADREQSLLFFSEGSARERKCRAAKPLELTERRTFLNILSPAIPTKNTIRLPIKRITETPSFLSQYCLFPIFSLFLTDHTWTFTMSQKSKLYQNLSSEGVINRETKKKKQQQQQQNINNNNNKLICYINFVSMAVSQVLIIYRPGLDAERLLITFRSSVQLKTTNYSDLKGFAFDVYLSV